jgi:uncharacterized protein
VFARTHCVGSLPGWGQGGEDKKLKPECAIVKANGLEGESPSSLEAVRKGVEPSKAGSGSLSRGPVASGETRFSSAAKRRIPGSVLAAGTFLPGLLGTWINFDSGPCPVYDLADQRTLMKTREEILASLGAAKAELQKRFRVRALALFGSYARNQQTEKSDVDILVEVDPSIGLGFVSLADELERRLQQKVDLVSSRAVKPNLRRLIEPDLIYV